MVRLDKKKKEKRIKSKRILKKSQPTLTLSSNKEPSILQHENRFFKQKMGEAKGLLFS